MVARISTPRSVRQALNYNEHKVKKDQARCIDAGNFLGDASQLNFYQKLAMFETRNSLNQRAATRTLHVSLNFDPSEKLTQQMLASIAAAYMEKLGFGEQPYLVYKHTDAGHPHIHILSTTIRADGSRINTHNIGRNQSEKARKEIEALYHLVRAGKNQNIGQQPAPVLIPPVIPTAEYGKAATKRSISNVLTKVISQYHYSGIAELNAILKQFNVMADRGQETSCMFRNGGLSYCVLDQQGKKTGMSVKASQFAMKPTLKNLEARFSESAGYKKKMKRQVQQRLGDVMQRKPGSLEQFRKMLREEGIVMAEHRNTQNFLYGVTYVDHHTKTVFKGSDLGKDFNATAINKMWEDKKKLEDHTPGDAGIQKVKITGRKQNLETGSSAPIQTSRILDAILDPATSPQYLPQQFKVRKKRKRPSNNS